MPQQSLISRLLRMILAFAAFVAVVCTLIYVGFEMKFQALNFTSKKAITKPKIAHQPVFYKTIGSTEDGTTSKTLAQKPTLGERYTLELKAFTSQLEAEKYVDKLQSKGVDAFYTPLNQGGNLIFRVRRGIYRDRTLAEKEALDLAKAQSISAKIVKLQ